MAIALYLGAVGAGLALIIWAASTLRTDPRGYTHIATCVQMADATRARTVLERKGIGVVLDDHRHRHSWWAGVRSEGPVRLLVPENRVGEAVDALHALVAEERRARYMRLVS
ncbi:MAG TPA: hypothetical protein VLT79_11510 [Gemmatimonadales bacterium]|nr:hypothetical protein [Gemmatimonadales bacterium]